MSAISSIRCVAAATALFLTCQAAQAQSASELIAKGDIADARYKADEALKSYLPAEKLEPGNVKILLRIARQYRHLMADTKPVNQKIKYGNLALAYGQKAAALAPDDSEAQLSPAITYGKMMPHMEKKDQVAASPKIKAAADRAIKLDPRNDSAWHVLGRWHQSLANVTGVKRAVGEMLYGKLPVGSNAQSIACYEKAIAINPRRLRHYIGEGITYAQMGDKANARKFLQKGLSMAETEKDDVEMKARGREELAKLR
jgi:tetratricopeptide (TPR) repeat protein